MREGGRICPSSGKVCYRGKGDAKAANRHAKFRIRTYYCEACRGWHVTNGDKHARQWGRRDS